ncbi:hypothetical protein H257_17152 [Aphanomyces astaci]|uniref:Uncharacterized protein n=1 Tax=Aphanomyces astaci TaxID=112090 RepID=W4FFR5_APHAT|nr:hypothetical protein H257_17152 [Aphanomyces astaci]ETV66362.1 hypothetical protein H257_17152 [Aphanomyces astaci]|eukprot:XP_009844137.1 hypothetical protein H257_17152 [Aphanomyces astaci]
MAAFLLIAILVYVMASFMAAAAGTNVNAIVTPTNVSVLGVPGVFTAPPGPSCVRKDAALAGVGACPGPQPRLAFGSTCQALPNTTPLVMGCVSVKTPAAPRATPTMAAATTRPPLPMSTTSMPSQTTRPVPPTTKGPTTSPLQSTSPRATLSVGVTSPPPSTPSLRTTEEIHTTKSPMYLHSTVIPSPTKARTKHIWSWVVVGVVVCGVGLMGCGIAKWRRNQTTSLPPGDGHAADMYHMAATPTDNVPVPWLDVPNTWRNGMAPMDSITKWDARDGEGSDALVLTPREKIPCLDTIGSYEDQRGCGSISSNISSPRRSSSVCSDVASVETVGSSEDQRGWGSVSSNTSSPRRSSSVGSDVSSDGQRGWGSESSNTSSPRRSSSVGRDVSDDQRGWGSASSKTSSPRRSSSVGSDVSDGQRWWGSESSNTSSPRRSSSVDSDVTDNSRWS